MTRCQQNLFVAGLLVLLTAGGARAQVVPHLGHLPLFFEAQGAGADTIQFLARSQDHQVLVSPAGIQLVLPEGTGMNMQFTGADAQARLAGQEELAGKINYLTGSDPSQWHTGIPTYAKVGVANLYPGVDAVYYGNDQQLEYDFNLAPGADPAVIKMRFQDSGKISLNGEGDLVLAVGSGKILQRKPEIYQTVKGVRQEIAGGYKIENGDTVVFAVGNYDHHLPLVIDPYILAYSTFLGGNGPESARAVALNNGSIYIAGQSMAKNLGTNNSSAAYQTNFQGGVGTGDAFVAKFTPVGTNINLVYFTYLGGSGDDQANALAVDAAGNAFVGGFTDSPNFPVVPAGVGVPGLGTHISGIINPALGAYFLDGFVAELAANGASLVYSAYLGGNLEDSVNALTIDAADNVYVTGYTFSTNLPVVNPIHFTLTGTNAPLLNYLACTNTYFNCNAFVGKIAAGGAQLDYLSYFGGQNYDIGTGIGVDPAGYIYVAGYTSSTNFPQVPQISLATNTISQFPAQLNGSNYVNFVFDAFVTKFDPTGADVIYSTYLGGTNTDEAMHLAVDATGVYVTGFTTSPTFPNTTVVTNTTTNYTGAHPIITTNVLYPVISQMVTNNINGALYTTNAFLTKIITGAGNVPSIAYSVVFGGNLIDVGYGVAVDPAGNAYVTGSTTSPTFPTNNTGGLLRSVLTGFNDAFVTAFNPTCSQPLYSIYLGGLANDYGYAIAVDGNTNAYVVGETYSATFPVTTNVMNLPTFSAWSKTRSPTYDGFVSEISPYSPDLVVSEIRPSVRVSWLYNPYIVPEMAGYKLQGSSLVATNWVTLTNAVLSNNVYSLTLPMTNGFQYFRLHQ